MAQLNRGRILQDALRRPGMIAVEQQQRAGIVFGIVEILADALKRIGGLAAVGDFVV